jgi:hypothetical protein
LSQAPSTADRVGYYIPARILQGFGRAVQIVRVTYVESFCVEPWLVRDSMNGRPIWS